MAEKVTIGNAELYLGDCLEILPLLPKADVVLTDPPYAEQTHKGARTGGDGDEVLITFKSITDAEYKVVAKSLVEAANRWVVMTCDIRHMLVAMGMDNFIRAGVFIKPNASPQFTGDRPGQGFEAVAIFHREGKKQWNGGGHHAVWSFNKENGQHPTQKPLALVNKWVNQFSNAGETILDPFMGSGTTGVACANLGRKFIGVEIEKKYFDIACERIDNAQRQQRLFA
jgi:site-specific DNA-methyltransferase (adenine-specific)